MKFASINCLTALGLASLLAGCTTPSGQPNYTANGALSGAASGAAIGALANCHDPGMGALIGAAAGALFGGLIGHSMDQQVQAQSRYFPPPPRPPPSVADIKAMTRSGLGDDVIIGQMVSTRAVYRLDADALVDLKKAGVSQKVITFMVNTPSFVSAAVPQAAPAVAYLGAPGPDYVWMAGEWDWRGGAWVWTGGRWVLPPFPHAIWVAARWESGPAGWHKVPGYWR